MANKYIIDTHALLWYLEGNVRLGDDAKSVMSTEDSEMILPIIALFEAALVIEKGRSGISEVSKLLRDVDADERIEIYPTIMPIFERCLTEEGRAIPELHDRIIVSTGLYLQDLGHNVSILTRDKTIIKADVLPVIW